ncbi:MAG: helix-turn-helix transcriptional regulator [Actinomycetia bacterium]|nr:helix-turn-helix transcriptional regulator [Actinomycetes bacterium]
MAPMDEVMHPMIAAITTAALGDSGSWVDVAVPVDRGAHTLLLGELLARHGPEGVLGAGRQLDIVATEPLLLALLNTDSPGLLFDKIERLNRFFHSSHRHRVHRLDGHGAELEHWSTTSVAPTPVESLFVCGLYLELLGRIGCASISCAFPGATTGDRDVYRDGRPSGVPVDHTGSWQIGWSSFEATRPLPGLDQLLLRHLPADLSEKSVGARVDAIVLTDLSRPWKLAAVAGRLTMSPRSLQRHLREEGRAFTTILRSTRVAAAQDLLRDPTRTVTDVAYLTGFADTAHFTRTFKQAIGATPSAWRATQPNSDAS